MRYAVLRGGFYFAIAERQPRPHNAGYQQGRASLLHIREAISMRHEERARNAVRGWIGAAVIGAVAWAGIVAAGVAALR